jgi:hypothetical protein
MTRDQAEYQGGNFLSSPAAEFANAVGSSLSAVPQEKATTRRLPARQKLISRSGAVTLGS